MSILIKGMEMPTNDELLCINIYPNGKVCIDLDLHCKQVATAVPVPPHGRLIDADALTDCLATLLQFPSNFVNGQWIVNTIREQPTIIDAEEEE